MVVSPNWGNPIQTPKETKLILIMGTPIEVGLLLGVPQVGSCEVRATCCSEQPVMVPLFQNFLSELLQAKLRFEGAFYSNLDGKWMQKLVV